MRAQSVVERLIVCAVTIVISVLTGVCRVSLCLQFPDLNVLLKGAGWYRQL